MVKSHLKTFVAQKTWDLNVKEQKFTVRPYPGTRPLHLSIPVSLLLKKMGFARTTREVSYLLGNNIVLADGRPVRARKSPVGLMDVVEVKGNAFRIMLNKGNKLIAVPIKKEDAALKPCKIIGKTVLRKGKMQLNLFDGRNIIVDKDSFKTNDTVLIEIKDGSIKEHIKLEKGAFVYLISGKHKAAFGVVDGILGDKVICRSGDNVYETARRHVFVIGSGKPLIDISSVV